jgi:hypothetical protein
MHVHSSVQGHDLAQHMIFLWAGLSVRLKIGIQTISNTARKQTNIEQQKHAANNFQ